MAYKHLLNFWPLVPAVDVQAISEAVKSGNEEDFEVPFNAFQKHHPSEHERKENTDILIMGDGVGCLTKTVARVHRHPSANLNIYVVTDFAESLARDLLLLLLLTEKSSTRGILERSEIFLEIFGNTLVRESTAEFVETESGKILEDISSSRRSAGTVPIVSLTFLKEKEVDELCDVFRRLKNEDFTYDVSKEWENSLRAYFGTRYDSRKNLFDYHFNMKLSHYPVISLKKYLEWRETGMAFKLRKGRYDRPNKTLYVDDKRDADSSELFCGDISTSPYIAFGVECKNEEMLKKANDQYSYTAEDISKFNVTDLVTEFISAETLNRANVHFFFYSTFYKSRRFENFFDAVYVTCDMTSWAANCSLSRVLKRGGVAVFETVNNVVNSTKDQKAKHVADIDSLAAENGLESCKLKCFSDSLKLFVRR